MLLSAKDISFAYSTSKPILRDLNFSVSTGEVVGLCAPSGKGKSSLGKILAGYETPNQGELRIDGDPYLNKGGYNPVQLMFQHPEKAVNPKWKMQKILNETWEPPLELIEAMGIKQEWMSRWPSELSGGELQRFCLLRALAPQTKFLIADEMTTMLDVITQAQIWDILLKHAAQQNMGIVVISHDDDLVKRLCTRVVYLSEIGGVL